MQSKVDFFQRRIIRIFVLNVQWPNIAKNEGKRTVVHNYLKKALKMVGKIARMDPSTSRSLCFTLCFIRIQTTQRKTTENMVKYNKTTIKKRTQYELE